MKRISILGSTGSIGTQTLSVVREHPDRLSVSAITGNHNISLLLRQIEEFKPELCCVTDETGASKLREQLPFSCKTEIVTGMEGLISAATIASCDTVVTAISGMIGLRPTAEAIRAGKTIALANKETLVTGGEYIMKLAKDNGVPILPVDSEHSAIFQCLNGTSEKELKRILLTASGGPFRGKSIAELKTVSVADALKHPSWSMGKKITIDSATLMNKGLEVIEAHHLFGTEPSKIEVVVHPQSIIHSAVEFSDHSVIAQLGLPDMRLPIQYALFYPERISNSLDSLSLFDVGTITFEKPDTAVFKCLRLAFDALKAGGTMPAALNAANEAAVELFLNGKISFTDIGDINERAIEGHNPIKADTIEAILETEVQIKNMIPKIIASLPPSV